MLRKSLKFMAVIIVMIMCWGLWVNLSIKHDEHEAMIRMVTEKAEVEHKEAIKRVVDKEKEQKKVMEYTVNGTTKNTNTYPYKMYSDVYIYYLSDPENVRSKDVEIVRVETTFYGPGLPGIYSSTAVYDI